MNPAPEAPSAVPSDAPSDSGDDTRADNLKRRQILDGARDCFLASGFDAASMGQIARAAKVSKGTLYVYFDSKEALFKALIIEQKRETAERTMPTLEDTEGPLAEVLITFASGLMRALTHPDHIALLRLVIGASERFPEIGRQLYEAGPDHGARRLARFLAERQARGELAAGDMDTAAWQFGALCQHPVVTRSILAGHPSPGEEEALSRAREIVATFLAAYAPR